eukprot:7091147-Pyramimonas_sp.AAC.1
MPFWPLELLKSRARYNLDEDCRALPLNFLELRPGLLQYEDVGHLGVLEYVGTDLQDLLMKSEVSLLPRADGPPTPPRVKVNGERIEDWWLIAAKLMEVLLWSGVDQTGALFRCRISEP